MVRVSDSGHVTGVEFPLLKEYTNNVGKLIQKINATPGLSGKEKANAIKNLQGITRKQMKEIVNGNQDKLKQEAITSLASLTPQQLEKIKEMKNE